ncbi:hypothetical protein I6E84_07565 [Psychrobacter sp. SCQQ22]|uniref:hypothetical protein n=1 Tax=Psychrobacter sp. SCQQ22 TaxID=2792059 RepID=UPI0018CD65C3|nr:hypothetical protein [Psychrobacter sp. SCQQ22]MBH0086073.1 hypothetical protein [Psychrobacter sp. SCQQ22]
MDTVNLETLASNPFVTLGSFSLAVLGITLAVVFYFKSQKNKTPCFEQSSNTIIEGLHNSLDGLEVRYKGSTQERITVTKLAFWNNGKDTIDRSDLVEKDPVRISIPEDIDILDIQIINVSEESSTVSIQENKACPNSYILNFDFLDHKEYFVIQVIHNGSSSEKIKIEGKIKGVKAIEKVTSSHVQSTISSSFPFFGEQMGMLLASPLLMKYVGSLTYFFMAMFAVWNLMIGNTQWFVWLGVIICLFISGASYYMFRHIVPVKI